MSPHELETQLKRTVTRGRVLTAPAQLAGYDADALGYKTYRPDAVVLPADADELVRLLQGCREINVPVSMRGAGTSLSGGPVAAQGGIVVHTSALRKVAHVHADGLWCEAECGVTLSQLDAELKPHGLFYPPDPSSGPVCTLGGNVAMNAGGAHCFRYGVTSNYVLGVEVVLPDGRVHRFGGPAGGRGPWREDWKRLMVGSEGTLGAFTRFWLRVLPRPEKVWTFRATYADLIQAERAVHSLVAHSSFPVAIELMDPRCVEMVENSAMAVGLPKDAFMIVTEIDGPQALVDARVQSVADILTAAGSADVSFSDDEEQRNRLWKARKVAGGLMGQISPDFLVQDAVIPKRALADVLQLVYDEADEADLSVVNVFHAGDGNLHPNFLFDARQPGELEKVEQISKRLMHRVVEVGGTLSGEHGIGNDKTAYMPLVFGEEAMRLQLAVPAVFNPLHRFNPLKVFTQRRFDEHHTIARQAPTTDEHRTPSGGTQSSRQQIERDPRCFDPFLDPVDGILCIAADATDADIRQQAAPHGLRYPFVLDENSTLQAQVRASGFAPASSRFGPVCDNIVGMNWRLPSGRIMRFGERVVKTTTGYDLFRFLLATQQTSGPNNPFGEPVDFVVRLRIDSGMTCVGEMSGPNQAVDTAIPRLMQSCWMHWFDAVDLVVSNGRLAGRLRIVVNCPQHEWEVIDAFLSSFATDHGLHWAADPTRSNPMDGCPDLVLKTTPVHVVKLARDVTQSAGVHCVALCAPGVVHVYAARHTELDCDWLSEIVAPHASLLDEHGGEWYSRHMMSPHRSDEEQDWLAVLEQEFRGS